MPTTNPLPDGFRVEREPDRNGESVRFVVYREGHVWKNGDPRSLLTVTLHLPSEMGLAHDGVPKVTFPSMGNYRSLEVALAMHAALAMAIDEAQNGSPDERVLDVWQGEAQSPEQALEIADNDWCHRWDRYDILDPELVSSETGSKVYRVVFVK